jgi:hypothetical protein
MDSSFRSNVDLIIYNLIIDFLIILIIRRIIFYFYMFFIVLITYVIYILIRRTATMPCGQYHFPL